MKKCVFLFVMIFMLFSLSTTVFAQDTNITDILPSETQDLLIDSGFNEISAEEILSLSPNEIFGFLIKSLKTAFDTPFISLFSICAVSLLISLVSGIKSNYLNTELQNTISTVGILCVFSSFSISIVSCIKETTEFINTTSNFIKVFVPALSSVIYLGGQSSTANNYQITVILASEVISDLISNVIIPLLYIFLAISVANHINSSLKLSTTLSFVKTSAVWILSISVMIFVSLITIKGIIAAETDTLALKTGRFFIGSFVPAVGGALSEAALTMQTGIKLIKSSSGIFGIIAAVLYFIPPLIKIILYKLALNVSSAVSEILGVDKISIILKDLSTIFGLLISIILSFSAVFVLSTAVIITLGV